MTHPLHAVLLLLLSGWLVVAQASGRGLYRTGFEVAKLLLSLDPT